MRRMWPPNRKLARSGSASNQQQGELVRPLSVRRIRGDIAEEWDIPQETGGDIEEGGGDTEEYSSDDYGEDEEVDIDERKEFIA